MAALADGEGELVFSNPSLNAFLLLVHFNLAQLGRLEGFGDKFLDVWAPVDDVHLFVVEFAHDIFDALSAQTDAGAHGIDALVIRMHGQLGAPAGFARDRNDLHGAIGDFGNFQREKFHHKLRVGTGKHDFRATTGFFHGFNKAAELFAGLVFLDRHAFAAWEGGLVAAEIYHHIAALKTTYSAADDIAHAILELIKDQRLFGAAQVLFKILAGVLGGDAAEPGGGHFLFDFVAEIGFINNLQRIESGNFVLRVGDPIHDYQFGVSAEFAGFRVGFHAQIAAGSHRFLGGGFEGILNRLVQGIAADALFLLVIIQ